MPAALAARAAAYGALDDGVPPVLLTVPEGVTGPVAGVQVHAVRGPKAPAALVSKGKPCGRTFEAASHRFIALSGLVAPESGTREQQARALFEMADAALRQAGGSMHTVARTWLWLGDILAWYGEFNRVRNRFFTECGLLNGDPSHNHLPASTGIGVRPAGGAALALDVVATVGPKASIEYFGAAGNQLSAFDYGSAFSRSARATTPAGETVYISGTASIDKAGKTIHLGEVEGQVDVTIKNIRAALQDANCGDGDVVQAFVYSKTPEVDRYFRKQYGDIEWPCIAVISDVCRDDLLFEVEATACPGARKA